MVNNDSRLLHHVNSDSNGENVYLQQTIALIDLSLTHSKLLSYVDVASFLQSNLLMQQRSITKAN